MSDPLDLEPIRAALEDPYHHELSAGDVIDLLAEVDRLRDEIADRANVEADLRAQLADEKARTKRLQKLDEVSLVSHAHVTNAVCEIADYLGIPEADDEGTLSIVLKISALVHEVWPVDAS